MAIKTLGSAKKFRVGRVSGNTAVFMYALSFRRSVSGHTSSLENSFKGTTDNPSRIALAFYDALWAYDGW